MDRFENCWNKKIKVIIDSTDQKIQWPIFSKSALALDGDKIIIEGYFFSLRTMNTETSIWEDVHILAIAKETTIKVCGVPQFRQDEFIRIKDNVNLTQASKVKILGILHLNQKGTNESLLSLTNTAIID
ncbi:MAG: hypothetical protein ACO3EE_08415 [Flavobacteriales bacterium]